MTTTPTDVAESSEYIRKVSVHYREAIRLRDERFMTHFNELSVSVRERFIQTRNEYIRLIVAEEDSPRDSTLIRFYRKAAKRFHPDVIKDDSKTDLFNSATEAYDKGDISTLQAIVLVDMADEYESLNDGDRNFLEEESDTLRNVGDTLFEKTAETIMAAAELERMSTNGFMIDVIAPGIASMELAIEARLSSQPERKTPPLLEG